MAPNYANIFMSILESKLIASFPRKPLFYRRYIDDMFIIWPHGEFNLKTFMDHVNNFHPHIKFTSEYSHTSIPFLDVAVTINNNRISTSLHSKSTDSHAYLNFHSSHPLGLKKSIIFSQCLRIKRICSDINDYNFHVNNLAGFFLSRGYPLNLIKSQITKAARRSRQDLLSPKIRPTCNRIPLILDFHPSITSLSRTIRNDFTPLQRNESTRLLFDQPPLLASRQPPNLKMILTSSCLSPPKRGNSKCNKPRCMICKLLITDTQIKLPHSSHTIHPPALTCDSSNVIYLLTCFKCNKGTYIGETGAKFRLRFNNHKQSIRKGNTDGFHVAEHFNSPDHNINDIRCALIACNFKSLKERRQSELKLIMKYKTHIFGLNKDLGIISDNTFPHADSAN
ncbi:uncharacterized protein LOC117112070 [Anneissia japonica]|uniref:uncharacterized protein LOC117112070 n=1 Tax=Anneissia japonica TaxID=1529436 RepID=UPI0014256735|nr:uncharacterized protein LOC117112070 [Anneissia japonica]